MATETLAPDAVLVSTNYTTLNVGDIDEDPDSPDATYGTWDGTGNTVCSVSFPTPTGNPTGGASQEFRVLIRRNGATTATDWSLALYEGGSAVGAALASGTLNDTDPIVVSGTWDAASLGTADGSAVECRLTQTSGGTGGARSGVEVGAVEWNVVYTAGIPNTNANAELAEGAGAANSDSAKVTANLAAATATGATAAAWAGIGPSGFTSATAEALDATADTSGAVTFNAEAAVATAEAIVVAASLTASAGYAQGRSV